MRLINYSDDSSGSEGEKQSGGPSKRGRSSLDYKVRNHGNIPLTTTKPGKRKSRREIVEEQQARDAAAAQEQNRIPTKSRARGGSGPPPRKWDISDLGNMNEEELLQALYADPELAQNLAEMSEKLATSDKAESTGAPAGASKSRRPPLGGKKPRKEFSEYPEHMKELVDGGVPVFQWVVLLVLLGAVLYQLRKILILPDAKEQQKGKGKGAKVKMGKTTAPDEKAALAAVEETLRAIDIDDIITSPTKNGASKAAKKAPPPSKKKKKAKANSGPSAKKNDSLDGPAGGEAKVSAGLAVPLTAPIQTAVTSALDDHDGGWQTVSKDAKPTENSTAILESKFESSVEKKNADTPVPPDTQAVATKKEAPVTVESTTASDSKKESTPPVALNSTANNKKKKKKKLKADVETTSGPSKDSTSSEPVAAALKSEPETEETDNDEALAKLLQREEEKFAQDATTNGSKEPTADEWEEVTTRKRKGSKSDNSDA